MDNEPAFPHKKTEEICCGMGHASDYKKVEYSGKTLCDYFAAKALQPLIAEMISRKANMVAFDEAACFEAVRLSFITANAMLEARKQ